MTSQRFKECLKIILKHEGGYSNHPADKGKATNFGITQRVYDEFNASRAKSLKNVREITSDEVGDIYYTSYWLPASCDNLPKPLDILVFDFAVNSGVGKAIKTLQLCVGVDADGKVGPKTISSVANVVSLMGIDSLCDSYLTARKDFFEDVVLRRPEQKVFIKGWMNRLAHLSKEANLV